MPTSEFKKPPIKMMDRGAVLAQRIHVFHFVRDFDREPWLPGGKSGIRRAIPLHWRATAIAPQANARNLDFSRIPDALGAPYSFWALGGIDDKKWHDAEAAGRLASDIPANHSPHFAPVIEPTLKTGTAAIVVAALAWLL